MAESLAAQTAALEEILVEENEPVIHVQPVTHCGYALNNWKSLIKRIYQVNNYTQLMVKTL